MQSINNGPGIVRLPANAQAIVHLNKSDFELRGSLSTVHPGIVVAKLLADGHRVLLVPAVPNMPTGQTTVSYRDENHMFLIEVSLLEPVDNPNYVEGNTVFSALGTEINDDPLVKTEAEPVAEPKAPETSSQTVTAKPGATGQAPAA